MHCKESVVQIMTPVERMMSGEEIGRYFGEKNWPDLVVNGYDIGGAPCLSNESD